MASDVPAGSTEQVVGLPLRRDPDLGRLALRGGAEPGDVALGGGTPLGGLLLGGGHEPGRDALGTLDQLVGAAARVGGDLVGLVARAVQGFLGLAGRGGAALGDGVLRGGTQLGGLEASLGPHDLGVLGGLGDHVGGLLLGQAEQLLDARAETGVRRPLALAELAVRLGQLAGELHGAGVQVLDPGACLADRTFQLAQAGLHLAAVVPAHDDGEHALAGVAHCGAPRHGHADSLRRRE
jgi:hypothetical protein